MIDTHCHIDTEKFDTDRKEVIENAIADGVESIIVPAIEEKGFNHLIQVCNEFNVLYFGIGVHPHNSDEITPNLLGKIEEIANTEQKCVAIGEVGLDYYYNFAPADVQIKAFKEQINIAKNLKLPIIVHNRDSNEDLMNILEIEQDGNLRGVLHCFSGDQEMLRQAIDLGFYISFTGNITYNKSNLVEVVKNTPIDNLLLETDSPWMAPIPYRGKRNEPKFVRFVAEKISEIKSILINEVILMTTENAKKLFRIATIILMFIFAANFVYSQSRTTIYDENYDEFVEHEDIYDLYPRTFGFGPVFGTNTIVETYDDGQDISYDGLFSYGFIANYRILKYLTISAAYHYSKSTEYVKKYKVDPSHFHAIELSSFLSPNPNGRVNFYGIIGISYMLNKYGRRIYNDEFPRGKKEYETDNRVAANTGLGFNVNIDMNNSGILSFMLEWKLNFALLKTSLQFDPRFDPDKQRDKHFRQTDISTFYSVPRLAVVWYPKFK